MKRFMAIIIGLCIILTWGCNDDYYSDGGLLDDQVAVLNTSTMQYLENNPDKFDTLSTLIKMCGLVDEINKTGNTFFAPQDYSIHNYFRLVLPDGPWPALEELPEELLEEISGILKNYIISGQQIVRSELSPTYSYATTLGGQKARFNLIREDYLGNVNMGAAFIVFSLDVSGEQSPRELYQSVRVAISGLRSTNGIVHVLTPDAHIFGFN